MSKQATAVNLEDERDIDLPMPTMFKVVRLVPKYITEPMMITNRRAAFTTEWVNGVTCISQTQLVEDRLTRPRKRKLSWL